MKKTIYYRGLSGLLACIMAVLSALSISNFLSTESKAAELGKVTLRVGERVEYNGYSTNYFYINGNLAYCLEPAKNTPLPADYAHEVLVNNDLLAKALYYVVGAPGAEELGEGFWQMADPGTWGIAPFGERYAYCHMFLAWIYSGLDFDAAFAGTSLPYQGFYEALKEDFWWRKSEIEKRTVADASLSITPETGKATWDIAQGIQRTEDFTLHGDSRNKVTISAPERAVVYNKETGESGKSVTVRGGQHFYFTSGVDVAGSYTSSKISGMMQNQYRSIIFLTAPGSQTMGGYSYNIDPVDPVSFNIDWADRGKIYLKKTSADTSATGDGIDDNYYSLSGAQYGIYRGGTFVDTLTANSSGEMESGWLPLGVYQIKELVNSMGYLLDTNTYNVEVKANQTANLTVKEQPQKGRILLHKKNARTNTSQVYNAEYTLKGAVYEVKNSKGALTGTITTDVNGEGRIENLPLGRYTIQEKTPSVGFQRDKNVYTVEITSENRTTAIFTKEVTSPEQEQMGKIVLQKVDSETGKAEPQGAASLKNALYDIFRKSTYKTGDNTQSASYAGTLTTNEQGKAESTNLFLDTYYVKERVPSSGYLLDGILYEVTLTSENREVLLFTKSVQSKENVIRGDIQIAKFASDLDGEDENDIKKPLEGIRFPLKSVTTGKVVYTIVTDKDGFGTTKSEDFPRGRIPYDTYIVIEENTPEGFMSISPFRVTISKEGVTLGYIIENKNIISAISVVKKDAETGDTVPVAGTEFRLLDKEKNVITMKTHYPGNETHETFKTDERGSFIFPEKLPVGTYYLEEVNAPKGMLKGEPVKFEVTAEGNWEEPLIIEYYNENVKGQITLKKTDSDTKGVVPSAVYGLYAAEDIVTADTTIQAQKNDLIKTGMTDERGEILFSDLYLGKYYVSEISPAPGYTLDEKSYPVEVEYIDQETPVVRETVKVKDTPTKVNILKVDKETSEPLEGAVFEVWREDVKGEDGNPIKTEYTTELDGIIELLYLTQGTYSVQEKIPPVGYGRNDKVYEFTIGIDGLMKGKNSYTIIVKDEKSKIQTTAKDKVTGTNRAVTAKETTIIDTINYEGLTSGQEYTVKGILMDRETKDILLIDGKEVTAERSFMPEKSSGTVDLEFIFDASSLIGKSIVVFERLYLDSVEVAAHTDIKDKGQTIYFPKHKIQTTAKDKATDSHQAIATKETTIIDTVNYESLIPGQEYTLKGFLMEKVSIEDSGKEAEQEVKKEIGKEFLIDGKPVTAEVTLKPEKSNGTIDLEFTFDASTLQGKNVVVFERLYQSGTEVAAHADINDRSQTVDFPEHSIKTLATGKETGSHEVAPKKETVVIDSVSYEGLIPGMEYTVKGIIMEKETEKPFLNDGKEITAETVFTSDASEGTVEVEFNLNTEGLEGKELVIYEKLYVQETEVAAHEDIEDKGQTITILTEPHIIKTGDSIDILLVGIVCLLAGVVTFIGVWKKAKK